MLLVCNGSHQKLTWLGILASWSFCICDGAWLVNSFFVFGVVVCCIFSFRDAMLVFTTVSPVCVAANGEGKSGL